MLRFLQQTLFSFRDCFSRSATFQLILPRKSGVIVKLPFLIQIPLDLNIPMRNAAYDVIMFSRITMRQAHEKICEYYKLLNTLNSTLTKKL